MLKNVKLKPVISILCKYGFCYMKKLVLKYHQYIKQFAPCASLCSWQIFTSGCSRLLLPRLPPYVFTNPSNISLACFCLICSSFYYLPQSWKEFNSWPGNFASTAVGCCNIILLNATNMLWVLVATPLLVISCVDRPLAHLKISQIPSKSMFGFDSQMINNCNVAYFAYFATFYTTLVQSANFWIIIKSHFGAVGRKSACAWTWERTKRDHHFSLICLKIPRSLFMSVHWFEWSKCIFSFQIENSISVTSKLNVVWNVVFQQGQDKWDFVFLRKRFIFLWNFHSFFFVVPRCMSGIVSTVVFTGLTAEKKHPLMQHVQQLVRSANPTAAFILAERGAVTR